MNSFINRLFIKEWLQYIPDVGVLSMIKEAAGWVDTNVVHYEEHLQKKRALNRDEIQCLLENMFTEIYLLRVAKQLHKRPAVPPS